MGVGGGKWRIAVIRYMWVGEKLLVEFCKFLCIYIPVAVMSLSKHVPELFRLIFEYIWHFSSKCRPCLPTFLSVQCSSFPESFAVPPMCLSRPHHVVLRAPTIVCEPWRQCLVKFIWVAWCLDLYLFHNPRRYRLGKQERFYSVGAGIIGGGDVMKVAMSR